MTALYTAVMRQAKSECGCAVHTVKNNRETGIIEEIALETLYRNPYRRYPMWDAILFELINNEKI